MNEETAHDTQQFISKRLSAIKSQRSTGELEDLALIIGMSFRAKRRLLFSCSFADGKSLGFALEKEISKMFLELAIMCKAVICCSYCDTAWSSHAFRLIMSVRSGLPVAKSVGREACQEEPESNPARHW